MIIVVTSAVITITEYSTVVPLGHDAIASYRGKAATCFPR